MDPVIPNFDRPTVFQILEAAFHRCADHDYALGYIINEEDMRACVYRNVRNALDLSDRWRVFTNLSCFAAPGTEEAYFKPDLVMFHSSAGGETARVEILAEIKHWPNAQKVEADVAKLAKLRTLYQPEEPDVAFFGIMGKSTSETEAIAAELGKRYAEVKVWLRPHFLRSGCLYQGPWDDVAKLDPWRKRLRHLR
jgi:hypothetical protein